MTNDINANVKEILEEVSVKGLSDVELTEEEKKFAVSANVTNSTLFFFMDFLKGKSDGCDAQVNQETEVGTPQSVEEQIKELSNGLKDASNCEDVSSGSTVSFPSATAPKNSKGSAIGK